MRSVNKLNSKKHSNSITFRPLQLYAVILPNRTLISVVDFLVPWVNYTKYNFLNLTYCFHFINWNTHCETLAQPSQTIFKFYYFYDIIQYYMDSSFPLE